MSLETTTNIFLQDVEEQAPVAKTETPKVSPQQHGEEELIRELMKLTTPTENPWRADFDIRIRECYDFKELRQWDSEDVQVILGAGVPALSIDRINRGLDTIKGMREQAGNKKKVVPRETTKPSDVALADILDKACEYFAYHGDYDDAFDDAFDTMLDIGIGMVKMGWDAKARGGEGELWTEPCDIESVMWSRTRDKKFRDIRWICQHHVMAWEDAMKLAPQKAPELKSMATVLSPDWEKTKGNGIETVLTRDYEQARLKADGIYSYPGQVDVWEFYVLRTIPLKRISSVVSVPMPGVTSVDGEPLLMPQMNVRHEPDNYTLQEGETSEDLYHDEWWMYKVAGRGNSGSVRDGSVGTSGTHILLEATHYGDRHPYFPYVAEFKKSGQPRGFIEPVIPHQKRINIAWSQGTHYNNKMIKAAMVVRDGDIKDNNIDHALQSSEIGSVLVLQKNAKDPMFNIQPQLNLHSIEEGNTARQDLDFAASSTEPVLRGQLGGSKSGVQTSILQNAATVPITKWTKAENGAKLNFWRYALTQIIAKVPPERLRRIVGEQFFDSLTQPQPQIDPMSGQMVGVIPPVIQLPLQIDASDFDVMIQDQSLTDFNKQQSFNALEALVGGGVAMDDEFRIRNAPLKDTDGALASNIKAKNDQMRMMMAQMQMMGEQIKALQKGTGNQKRNAMQGRNAPQTKQKMLGGTSPHKP